MVSTQLGVRQAIQALSLLNSEVMAIVIQIQTGLSGMVRSYHFSENYWKDGEWTMTIRNEKVHDLPIESMTISCCINMKS